jgi:site-specific DNA-adenine methylase
MSVAAARKLQAPFPYFGGKSRIAAEVWQRFGAVRNYVEPFFGSGAMLLCRPQPFEGTETVNDIDGMVANFWRAVKADPESVAQHADHPVNENDLHARHAWLVGQKETLSARLEGSPDFFDAKIAGWWCWGMCCWIGGGFCSGQGPWSVVEVDGESRLVRNAGQGVNRKRVHLGDAGRGVNRQRVHLGDAGQGVNRQRVELVAWMEALAERLRNVRVCSGDWARVCTSTPTLKMGLTAVFLDPPYADTAGRRADLYCHDSLSVAHDVREWALANGDNPKLRIALCGYDGEHAMPESWECLAWKTGGGYASQSRRDNVNSRRERVWFSPHCVRSEGMFA